MEIRKITEKERRSVVELFRYAYTEWSDKEIKDEDLWEVIPNETYGYFDNKKLVSTVIVHKFQQSVRGVLKECGGVAGVASHPEARRKGYIRQLMMEAFKEMRAMGQCVSMLDPFKESFYAKFGYVSSTAPYIVKAPLSAIKHSEKEDADPDWEIERVRAVEAKDPLLAFIREVGPVKHHGFILMKDVPDQVWKQRTKDSLVVFVKHKGTIQAAARYRIKSTRQIDESVTDMTVIDLFWKSPDARVKLFDFFAKHADQIKTIIIHAPLDTAVERWFTDTELKVQRGHPWMVRVIDAPQAVVDLPAQGEDMITLELTDPECTWNNGVFMLHSERNRLRMTKSTGKPTVKASIKAFTALVYGTLPAEELEFQKELYITESWARHTLQRWFPCIPIYNVVYF